MDNFRDFRLVIIMLVVLIGGWLAVNILSEVLSTPRQQDHSITITVKSR